MQDVLIIIIVLRPFFHTKARVRHYQQLNYSIPTYSAHPSFLIQTFHVCCHPLNPCFPTPSLPYATYHLQISALRNPIISLFTFHMPEPSQPATTDNSIHTFNTQSMPEHFTCSSVLQGHSHLTILFSVLTNLCISSTFI